MHTFNDTQGRTWTVTINVDAIRRVRALLNINLLETVEGKLLERLITDPVLLCDILFALIQPEAEAKQVSDEDFGRALGGDVLDHATTALLEELVDFFPSGRRAVFRKALEKLKQLEGIALETATRRLESSELEQQMAAALASIPAAATPGSSSGSSPESPA
ncbi:MAG: hypothetical protein KatS3mg114_0496 [Planctomycetaceae bacterium]|nr:MAG: hypothetical protein KatS3mg114_0496 [Planctomycetaceae bacterium]